MLVLKDPIKSPAPIVFTDEHYTLIEVQYPEVKQFASRASKERVSISNTNNTLWFHIKDFSDLVGCCGLYLAKKKCRIKGDWILPQYRGKGFGEFITQCRLHLAKELEYDTIEVLTLHPHYYEAKGFTIHKETRKGVWLADKEI
jgi:N-acetylglutamate synthase-like GNAT family acetyltransferase